MIQTLPSLPRESALAASLGLALGLAAAANPVLGLAGVGLLVAAAGLTAPTAVWVGATIVAAVGGRALVPFGFPDTIALLAIPLPWVALALALYRYQASRLASGILIGLALLLVAGLLSGIFNETEPLRPLFYLALLAGPFALVAALVVDPPTDSERRGLAVLLTGLILLQIPYALWQVSVYGVSDFVQGTFIGSKVGAHTTAAISLVGAAWLALRGQLSAVRVVMVTLLLAVPLLAAANQVIFAFPLALVLVAVTSSRRLAAAGLLGIGVVFALLLLPGWNSDYARNSLDRVSFAVKPDSIEALADGIAEQPPTLLLGQGPAMSVSHASFLTVEDDAEVAALGLEPAEVPNSFNLREIDLSGSLRRPESSVLGVFGDLGLLGVAAYGLLFLYVFNECRRRPTATAQAAAVGLAMAVILGYLSDWLEQPGFMLVVAMLAGLALAEAAVERRRDGMSI